MEFEKFKSIILEYKKISDQFSELHDIGFDFFEGKYQITCNVSNLFDYLFTEIYGENGLNWINWFVYETEFGKKKMNGSIENIKVTSTIESIHNVLEKKYKNDIKSK
jgi:hypothetical protein